MAPSATGAAPKAEGEVYDVLIVGAGISGVNAAYRIQEAFPKYTYAILENRDAIGGTWDLFRYPGIRSDSDLHTFGFPWRPWMHPQDIAQGDAIRQYIKESAALYGIDKHILFQHKALSADWSSDLNEWRLEVEAQGKTKAIHARFLCFCTGYYDYENPLKTVIPGLDNFKGQVIHPQFWPKDLDYTDKKVSIIGSGATAVTLLPILAEKAAKVTLIQRSPSYFISVPAISPSSQFVARSLPGWLGHRMVRLKNIFLPYVFFRFCRAFPNAARRLLQKRTKELLPASYQINPHFQPKYNPWEQRLCICPDEDFFKSLREGKSDIVTGKIESVSDTQLHVRGSYASDANGTPTDETVIDADIIVTATGLKLHVAGGMKLSVDGKVVDLSSKFFWKGVMLEDVPNAAMTVGYTNASWTLGADATALHVCRLLRQMDSQGARMVCPRVPSEEKAQMKQEAALNLNSTYIQAGKHLLPKVGDHWPWKGRTSYWADMWQVWFGSLKRGLEFV